MITVDETPYSIVTQPTTSCSSTSFNILSEIPASNNELASLMKTHYNRVMNHGDFMKYFGKFNFIKFLRKSNIVLLEQGYNFSDYMNIIFSEEHNFLLEYQLFDGNGVSCDTLVEVEIPQGAQITIKKSYFLTDRIYIAHNCHKIGTSRIYAPRMFVQITFLRNEHLWADKSDEFKKDAIDEASEMYSIICKLLDNITNFDIANSILEKNCELFIHVDMEKAHPEIKKRILNNHYAKNMFTNADEKTQRRYNEIMGKTLATACINACCGIEKIKEAKARILQRQLETVKKTPRI